jgi:hypothetical protein
MKRNYTIPTKFFCESKKSPAHVIKQPRKLPCGRNMCLECIDQLSTSIKNFTCPFCVRVHTITSNDLSRNMMLEYSLDEELKSICRYTKNELQSKNQKLKDLNDERKVIQFNKFDFIQNDIDVRIESLKICLEKLKNTLTSKIDTIKLDLSIKLTSVEKEFSMENSKNIQLNFDKALSTRHSLNKLVIDIEPKIKPSFVDLTMNNLVGVLSRFEANVFDMQKFSNSNYKPSAFRLDMNLCDIAYFSDGKYISICYNQNGIFVLNKNFKLLNRVEQIDETILFKPIQVDYNEVDKIVLVCVHLDKNSTRRQVLMIDRNFKEILFKFSEYNASSFYTDKDYFYILDLSIRNLIFIDVNTKCPIKSVPLFQDKPDDYNIEHEAYSTSITRELIAVNFKREKVFLYSTATGGLHSIVERPFDFVFINGICLKSSGIFMHFNHMFSDEFVFYEKSQNSNFVSKHSLKISEEGSLKGSCKLKSSGEIFYLILWGQELIIL